MFGWAPTMSCTLLIERASMVGTKLRGFDPSIVPIS